MDLPLVERRKVVEYFVYILKSKVFDRLYIGFTANLSKRLEEHNRGKVKSTKFYCPYQLMYFEKYMNKTKARKRELFLKTGVGRKIVKKLIDNWRGAGVA